MFAHHFLNKVGMLNLLNVIRSLLTPRHTNSRKMATNRASDFHESSPDGLEELQDISIRHLSDEGTEGYRKNTKQHTPAPLCAGKRLSIKCFTSLEDDDKLASQSYTLDANEPGISQHTLVPNIELVVNAAAVVLVEELHPNIDVEHQSLELLDFVSVPGLKMSQPT